MDTTREVEHATVFVPHKTGTYEFRIHDWNLLMPTYGNSITSPVFSISGNDRWVLEVFPYGRSSAEEGRTTIILHNASNESFRMCCDVLVRNKTGRYGCMAHTSNIEVESVGHESDSWVATDDLDYKEVCEWCIDNTFAVKVEMTVLFTPQVYECEFSQVDRATLSRDLEKLMNGFKTDVTLCSGENQIACHQCILSARSPVFHKMFSSTKTKVKMSFHAGKLTVKKIASTCLTEFVKFIYTDNCSPFVWEYIEGEKNEILLGLYVASVLYNVPGLQFRCEQVLIQNLSSTNVCEYLLLANTYPVCINLKKACIKYIAFHVPEIVKSDMFQQIDGELCREVLTAVAEESQTYDFHPNSDDTGDGSGVPPKPKRKYARSDTTPTGASKYGIASPQVSGSGSRMYGQKNNNKEYDPEHEQHARMIAGHTFLPKGSSLTPEIAGKDESFNLSIPQNRSEDTTESAPTDITRNIYLSNGTVQSSQIADSRDDLSDVSTPLNQNYRPFVGKKERSATLWSDQPELSKSGNNNKKEVETVPIVGRADTLSDTSTWTNKSEMGSSSHMSGKGTLAPENVIPDTTVPSEEGYYTELRNEDDAAAQPSPHPQLGHESFEESRPRKEIAQHPE